jgi:uncharacterized protein (DUF342 family)
MPAGGGVGCESHEEECIMDVEQGLRDYLEMKATIAYIENELRCLYSRKDAACKCEDGESPVDEAWEERITRLTARLEHKEYTLRKLDALLSALDERERFVATKYYIQHLTWRDVVTHFNREMPSPREVDALKAVRRRMLNKFMRVQKSTL